MLNYITLPITEPTWIFFLVLVIILFAPIILERLHIPHIIGMILAGVLIGEHGFNILERDSSFELFGKVGLYYIMFLAGLEIDMEDFKKNKTKGILFGLITFSIPMVLGVWSSMEILGFGFTTALLLSSMYASHTLITYPIVSRYGLSKLRSVNITIGGTIVAVTLALIVLAVVGGMYKGTSSGMYWISLFFKVALLTFVIIFFLPRIGRYFFKKYSDNITQFVFVLAMVFLGAGLMQLVGMEGILGAFLVGLVLNRLIPFVSPLMNRLEFVGNALFVPYFLIGVGMLIDVKALFAGGEALKVAAVMVIVATATKWIAAFVTQKLFKMNRNERSMVFGLSNAHAAAALAAVMVGNKIVMENGEKLLNDNVLNGTVVMILFACIISSLATERSARKFALDEKLQFADKENEEKELPEQILIPIANPETINNLVNLALLIRDVKAQTPLTALNIITDSKNLANRRSSGEKNLEKAAQIAASADVKVNTLTRYDVNVATGISHTIHETGATAVIVGLHHKSSIIDTFFGPLTDSLLKGTFREVMIARFLVPVNTIRKIHVAVPPKAEYEIGFAKWIEHLARITKQLGCEIRFYGVGETLQYIEKLVNREGQNLRSSFHIDTVWNNFEKIKAGMSNDHLFVLASARRGSISYDASFEKMPSMLARNFSDCSIMVLYPEQFEHSEDIVSFTDPLRHNESQHYEKVREWLSGLLR